MKLDRPHTIRGTLTAEAGERARDRAGTSAWHIGPAEGVEADRRQSLQQEREAVEPAAIPEADREGAARRHAEALARELLALGSEAAGLVRADDDGLPRVVDTEA